MMKQIKIKIKDLLNHSNNNKKILNKVKKIKVIK